MVQGSTGVMQPKQQYVTTTNEPNGYTSVILPANKNRFRLVARLCRSVRITKFNLKVDHICANGSPLSVAVAYVTYTGKVGSMTFSLQMLWI